MNELVFYFRFEGREERANHSLSEKRHLNLPRDNSRLNVTSHLLEDPLQGSPGRVSPSFSYVPEICGAGTEPRGPNRWESPFMSRLSRVASLKKKKGSISPSPNPPAEEVVSTSP